MKKRTARRRAIWAYNNREARRHGGDHPALPCVLRQYDRDVRRIMSRL